jgi:toxin YoeB
MTRHERRLAVVHDQCLEDLEYFAERAPRLAVKALKLMRETLREPSSGSGKPESLKGLPNVWSRRVDQEHRLVYRVLADRVDFLQARYHY